MRKELLYLFSFFILLVSISTLRVSHVCLRKIPFRKALVERHLLEIFDHFKYFTGIFSLLGIIDLSPKAATV